MARERKGTEQQPKHELITQGKDVIQRYLQAIDTEHITEQLATPATRTEFVDEILYYLQMRIIHTQK